MFSNPTIYLSKSCFPKLILVLLFVSLEHQVYSQDGSKDGSGGSQYKHVLTTTKLSLLPQGGKKDILGHEFTDQSLGFTALQPRTKDFERHEFLGDRVLGLVTAHVLYKCFPLQDIGFLSECFAQLVSKPSLLKMYNGWDIDPSLLASSCYQPPVTGSIAEKTASDIVEAFMGAIYRDAGLSVVQSFGEKLLRDHYKLDVGAGKACLLKPSSTAMAKMSTFIQRKGLPEFLKVMDYEFNNIKFLFDAFQHPSVGGSGFKKLDFIGVRVLALVVAEKVFDDYPSAEEGILMTHNEQIINNDNLERIFQNWQLWRFLVKQHGGIISALFAPERVSNRMACNSLRAFIGAVYLDGGWQSVSHVAQKLLYTNPPKNYITPIVKFGSLMSIKQHSQDDDIAPDEQDAHSSMNGETTTSTPKATVLAESSSAIASSQTLAHTSEFIKQQSPYTLKTLQTNKPNGKVGNSQNMQDWPALSSQKLSTQGGETPLAPSILPESSIILTNQPTYLAVLKRKESDKSQSTATEAQTREAWPALNPNKIHTLQPVQHKRSGAQAWHDTQTTMKAIIPSRKDEK